MLSSLRLVRWMKLAAFPGPGIAPVQCHASHDARMWMNSAGRLSAADNRGRRREEDAYEEELDTDPVEAKLGLLEKEERRIRNATKFHKIRRQMSERGAPERRLTWDAIEQIRYLKQESPQEWTVQRLAEGFSVSPDTISRILRSKFTPPPGRKIKQDLKALATVKPLSLRDGQTDLSKKGQIRLPTPDGSVPPMLSSGNTGALTALSPEAQVPAEFETGLVPSGGEHTSLTRGTSQISLFPSVKQSALQQQPNENQEQMEAEEAKISETEYESNSDRVFLTDTELEELIHTLQEKPSAVEQKGREFFDSQGNFLYRI
ncbi:neugrin [Astyanax mexicanus]|uniref:neugrin n=1 Tax=Astyanax mexicanus TaxID=7994 RepID=UPI0020CB5F00|nr:neugrin [Astyanax mexicanus]